MNSSMEIVVIAVSVALALGLTLILLAMHFMVKRVNQTAEDGHHGSLDRPVWTPGVSKVLRPNLKKGMHYLTLGKKNGYYRCFRGLTQEWVWKGFLE